MENSSIFVITLWNFKLNFHIRRGNSTNFCLTFMELHVITCQPYGVSTLLPPCGNYPPPLKRLEFPNSEI